jgi:hypothetical protein
MKWKAPKLIDQTHARPKQPLVKKTNCTQTQHKANIAFIVHNPPLILVLCINSDDQLFFVFLCFLMVSNGFIFFIVYVDDYIVFNNQLPLIHHIKTILFREFEMFNEGALQYTIRNAIIINYEKNQNNASNHISYC